MGVGNKAAVVGHRRNTFGHRRTNGPTKTGRRRIVLPRPNSSPLLPTTWPRREASCSSPSWERPSRGSIHLLKLAQRCSEGCRGCGGSPLAYSGSGTSSPPPARIGWWHARSWPKSWEERTRPTMMTWTPRTLGPHRQPWRVSSPSWSPILASTSTGRSNVQEQLRGQIHGQNDLRNRKTPIE
jgi:hypothetical protein